jgi:hypothetical protein
VVPHRPGRGAWARFGAARFGWCTSLFWWPRSVEPPKLPTGQQIGRDGA